MSFSRVKKFHQFLLKTESGLLIGLLLLMIIIAVIQIVMRNFMGAGLIWAESLLRITVLWLALLGAMVASRKNEHIAIDVLANKLPQSFKNIIVRLTRTVTAILCFTVAWFSFKFVLDEYEYGGIAFGIIPHWLCESIIPFSFFIMAIRYLASAIYINLPETQR